jgi:uncharacterized lipoprotein
MSLSTSTARALLATTLVTALLAASGCSKMHRPDGTFRFFPDRHNADYDKSKENRPLEVPPDLDTPATDPSMAIPAVHASAGSVMAPAGGGPGFAVTDTVGGTWERMGHALERINGVTITQRAQLLNSYEVQFKGATMLLRANSEGAQSTRVDAVDANGNPVRTPVAAELLGLLRGRIG